MSATTCDASSAMSCEKSLVIFIRFNYQNVWYGKLIKVLYIHVPVCFI